MIVECPGCKSRYDVTGRPGGTLARCRCGTQFELPHPSASAGALGCPKCGGNVSPDCNHCTYCDAALKLQACPRCFARIFSGSKHCNHCGAKVEVAATVGAHGDADPRGCPRCDDHGRLTARLVGDVLLDECHTCHGVFIDCEALERVIKQRDETTAAELVGNRPQHEADITAQPQGRMYVKCPDCEGIMNRVNFGRRSGIIVDSCRAHGTWFDGGELPRVIEFVQKGLYVDSAALDRERARAEARERARRPSGGASVLMASSRPRSHDRTFGLLGSVLGGIARTLLD